MLNTFLQIIKILSRVKRARKEKVANFNAWLGIWGRRELEFTPPFTEHWVSDPLQAFRVLSQRRKLRHRGVKSHAQGGPACKQ